MKEDLYWIWLSRIENLNKRALDKLLTRYKSVSNIWKVENAIELMQTGITENLGKKIVSKEYKKDLEKYAEYLEKNKIELITFENKYYPHNLSKIYDPPISIYIKGNKEILNDISIAIIGCRECSEYGKDVTKKFAYQLSAVNINIISGLARGIDKYAHIGSLESNIGKTIAVLRHRCGRFRYIPI